MNITALFEQLIQLNEQERIEAKTAKEIGKSILETICAFANEPNLKGGYLLLGVSETETQDNPRYRIVGVESPQKLIEDLVSQCRTIFNKPISLRVKQDKIDGKILVGVFVPEVSNEVKPIYFKKQGLPKGAYRRNGASDVQCSEDDLLILYQNRKIESYDYSMLDEANWEDIDQDAIESYRNERKAIYPQASELQLTDQQLLQALGCLRNIDGNMKITVAGLLLFGTKPAMRRLLTSIKIDYIRVSGTQWMHDPDNRYTASIEIRDSAINCIRRAEAAIMDDLPKAFLLPEGALQRQDIPIIPAKVIREAIVNAVIHRDYRVQQAIQIIRYANRIEIRNPGYSLISEEHLGRPGSRSRNTKLSEVLHETRFAEKKGTGIRLMREKMQEAGLSPPLFESDRNGDMFVATFLFHHFLNDRDIDWLAEFKDFDLSNEQARALIFVREVGAIDNWAYRNLNHVDILTASNSLRQLRDSKLLDAKNKKMTTYYVAGQQILQFLNKEQVLEGKEQVLEGKEQVLEGKEQVLEGKEQVLNSMKELPKSVQKLLGQLGKKAPKELVREAILELCALRPMSSDELANILNREQARLIRVYLTPMVKEGLLEYQFPQMIKHPEQAYLLKKT
jgi:ATP-dependent DNA helicase RecG